MIVYVIDIYISRVHTVRDHCPLLHWMFQHVFQFNFPAKRIPDSEITIFGMLALFIRGTFKDVPVNYRQNGEKKKQSLGMEVLLTSVREKSLSRREAN